MIDLRTASELLDFSARIGEGQQAKDQLEGAVAIHNILAERGVAYLADEVGMGKTYVALGALALFRHYRPDFRALIIAPRRNIQHKWMKEFRNFVAYNVRFPDLRVKALDGRSARPLVACESLLDLAYEVTLNPDRDFFLRLSSFSLSVAGKELVDSEAARRFRDGLRRHLPWMRDEVFDLRHKREFKDNMARALCCALPRFDLVIIDEGHNLKHGFGENVSDRNRVLALATGHPGGAADPKLFPGYGRRAKRVLFLSATPVEESYRHLWNQLDIFGLGGPYERLRKSEVEEEEKKAIAARFLIRRVTQLRVGGEEYTKNLYRREWRRGGVSTHDKPIRVDDPRQRLVVALVQKKVSELLGHERFNSSFQIGMLASFESFLETTRLKREDGEVGNFDDPNQTDRALEREGIDVADLNRLSRSYRTTFGAEMPHPKMDALVDSLSEAWTRGEKALIFVRRVASVKELKRKLDERYDGWLMRRLTDELPEGLHAELRNRFEQYRVEKSEAPEAEYSSDDDSDPGGKDTFFAWFFRGEGPRGVVSGANIQQRFIQKGTAYSTFFGDNYVADLLSCRPGGVEGCLGQALGIGPDELKALLRERSKRYLSRAKKPARADRFEAVQAAAVELLKDREGSHQEGARVVWHQRFETSLKFHHAVEAPEVGDYLELHTFFTELRERGTLRDRLWPTPVDPEPGQAFRGRELRAQLLASAARLGHAFIDLYVMTIRRLGSLRLRAQEAADDDGADTYLARISEYLDILERQMHTRREERGWGAFDELADISDNFDLLLDVNEPEARTKPLVETAQIFGRLLRRQKPVGGMSGQVNQTLVRQFRMPGYPLVLITTDLLQEGEDLHTFCSAVHHYGIAWTPSSMEQRVGRVDRVRSHTERRLTSVEGRLPLPKELLQVYFPHLEDTVEVLQVQRVLERINIFLRLMHEGLTVARGDERTIDAGKEFVRGRILIPQVQERLRSAFPVMPEQLRQDEKGLVVGPNVAQQQNERFKSLAEAPLPDLDVVWEPPVEPGMLLGTVRLGSRVQPFTLLLRSVEEYPVVRCISPVGCVRPGADQYAVVANAALLPARVGAVLTREERTYDLTVEGDVLFASDTKTDPARIAALIRSVTRQADVLEQKHLPGRDEVLATFREELRQEGGHGR